MQRQESSQEIFLLSRWLGAILFCIWTVLLSAQKIIEVKPQAGEGVFELLRRNNVPIAFSQEFIELNNKKLGENEALLAGFTYQIKSSWQSVEKAEEWRTYPLFGDKYERLKIIDHSLEGAIFYLVSGHGGPDPGAVGKRGGRELCEDEYAYDVTLRLARWLIERDALVYMIIRDKNDGIRDDAYLKCDRDEYAYTRGKVPRGHNDRLIQRTDVVNSLNKKNRGVKYQRMVAIHVDSRSQRENVDVFFYHHHLSSKGKELANDLVKTFDAKYEEYQPNRDYRGDVSDRSGLFVLKNTNPAAVFVELGNIANARDQRRFIVTENRQALAKWLGEGLAKNYQKNR
jgi:N-acetylmuramoyl-L-alanine amidase